MRRAKVTVLGSANIDLVIRAPRLPSRGETLLGDTFDIFTGGKGFNQATAAARLGAAVTLIGCIGDDPFAEMLRAAIAAEKIDSQHVKTDAVAGTGVATVVVQPGGDNSILVVPRANMCITSEDIDAAEDCIASADVLLLQLETPVDASERAAAIARANGTIVLLDPAPVRPIPSTFLAKVDILKPNRTEAAVLSGHAVTTVETGIAAAEALRAAIAKDGLSAVVLTLGEQGAVLCTSAGTDHIPARSVAAVDTTGAGDAFSGGLATALAKGVKLVEAVAYATAAGAAAVMVPGATPSMPTSERIDAILSSSLSRHRSFRSVM